MDYLPEGSKNVTLYASLNGGTPVLAPGVGLGMGLLTEMIGGFFLVFVILMVAVDEENKSNLKAVAIGFCLLVIILAG